MGRPSITAVHPRFAEVRGDARPGPNGGSYDIKRLARTRRCASCRRTAPVPGCVLIRTLRPDVWYAAARRRPTGSIWTAVHTRGARTSAGRRHAACAETQCARSCRRRCGHPVTRWSPQSRDRTARSMPIVCQCQPVSAAQTVVQPSRLVESVGKTYGQGCATQDDGRSPIAMPRTFPPGLRSAVRRSAVQAQEGCDFGGDMRGNEEEEEVTGGWQRA